MHINLIVLRQLKHFWIVMAFVEVDAVDFVVLILLLIPLRFIFVKLFQILIWVQRHIIFLKFHGFPSDIYWFGLQIIHRIPAHFKLHVNVAISCLHGFVQDFCVELFFLLDGVLGELVESLLRNQLIILFRRRRRNRKTNEPGFAVAEDGDPLLNLLSIFLHLFLQLIQKSFLRGNYELLIDFVAVLMNLFMFFLFLGWCGTFPQKPLKPPHSLPLLILNLKVLNLDPIAKYLTAARPLVPKVNEVSGSAAAHVEGVFEVVDTKLSGGEAAHKIRAIRLLLIVPKFIALFAVVAIVVLVLHTIITHPIHSNTRLILNNFLNFFRFCGLSKLLFQFLFFFHELEKDLLIIQMIATIHIITKI